MIKSFALFAGWAFVGLVLSYGLLYLFTPFGLLIVGACAGLASLLGTLSTRAWPEVIGLVAGAGGFCCVVAASAASPLAWATIGVALIAGALVAYAVSTASPAVP